MSTEDPKVNDCNSNTKVNKVGEFEMWPKKYKISEWLKTHPIVEKASN